MIRRLKRFRLPLPIIGITLLTGVVLINNALTGCSNSSSEKSDQDVILEVDKAPAVEQPSKPTDKRSAETEITATSVNSDVDEQTGSRNEPSLSVNPLFTPEVSNKPVNNQSPDAIQVRRETRALWARLEADNKSISKGDIDALVAQLDEAHLNVILFKVYHDGVVFFEPSHKRFPDISQRLSNHSAFAEPDYPDALSYLLAVRDKRRADDDPFNDFQVHAWVSVMIGGDRGKGWPQPNKTQPYALNALFPEFTLKYGAYYEKEDDRFARHDTSVVQQPKFRAYMTDLIAGLAEDYPLDGIHLDHIRTNGICFNNEPLDYPGTEFDYPGCQEDFKAFTRENYGREYTLWEDTDGHKTIQDGGSGRVAAWQEQAVSSLVKKIHDELKALNPNLIISVASVRNDPSPEARLKDINGQVAWEWLNNGWIDAVFVTTYTSDTQGVINIIRKYRDVIGDEENRVKVFPGLLTYSLDDKEEWSYLVAEQADAVLHGLWLDHPLEPPARGLALFRAKRFGTKAIEALAEGPFKEPALPFWGEPEPTIVPSP